MVGELGFGAELYHPGGIEFWGHVSLLKAGIVLADRVTTVSPRYAQEIQTPEQGFGFEGLLQSRKNDLVGILNGCDYAVWNPETDPHLPSRYSAANLDGKRACKSALQRELGLPELPRTPLCGSISRLTDQKGFDLVTEALPTILEGDVQYVVLGSGEPRLEAALAELANAFPRKLAVRIAYDEKLAHRIEAGCDLYVMPSRFEPCGLNQMYSLRYGTPPIVRATGGLDDTISDFSSADSTGFKFTPYSGAALGEAWRRAILAYFSGAIRSPRSSSAAWREIFVASASATRATPRCTAHARRVICFGAGRPGGERRPRHVSLVRRQRRLVPSTPAPASPPAASTCSTTPSAPTSSSAPPPAAST